MPPLSHPANAYTRHGACIVPPVNCRGDARIARVPHPIETQ